uniref:Transcription factor RF2a n=3 Tax=Solanum tuberosum TaxID=4113 RepID=M1CBU5_SOLTU
MMYNGKSSLLPPKSPFPSMAPSYVDYVPSSAFNQKGIQKPREGHSHHQRTSSESCIIEEQPSWLDDLLNEPETHVRKGSHRRSSSDSFAYFDYANAANLDYTVQVDNKFRNMPHILSWGSQDFDYYKDARQTASFVDQNSSIRRKNRENDVSSTTVSHLRSLSSPGEDLRIQRSGSPCLPQDGDMSRSAGSDKQDVAESGPPYPKGSVEKKDSSQSKSSSSETDTKRAKQQFAQRSRVRKLQYIAELERNVQALQAEGSEVSAELEFLNQQNLILSMENKALKQRLENLAQEQLIKYLEHEVLERERGRLRALYQQLHQQPQPQQHKPSYSHRRSTSRDLDQQFANLTLKQKEAERDAVSGQLHI